MTSYSRSRGQRRRSRSGSRPRHNRLTFRALCPGLDENTCGAAKSFCKFNKNTGCRALPRRTGSKCTLMNANGKEGCLKDPRCRFGKRGCTSKPWAFSLKELNESYDPDAPVTQAGGRKRKYSKRRKSRGKKSRSRSRSRRRSRSKRSKRTKRRKSRKSRKSRRKSRRKSTRRSRSRSHRR